MSVTIKAAKITAVAIVAAAVITSGVMLFLNNESGSRDVYTKSEQSPIIQNSENFTVNIGYNPAAVEKTDERTNEEEKISKIFIGANERYLESLFGVPAVTNIVKSISAKEVQYSFKRFYLQLLYDKNSNLFFYSITSKDVNFYPVIPKLGKTLGLNTFKEMTIIDTGFQHEATHLYSYVTSKHYGYGEYIYLGNGGNYHNYYLAYNSAGVDYSDRNTFTTYVKGWEGRDDLAGFRAGVRPNSYGVGDMVGVSNENLLYEIGAEFYTFRDEPLNLTKQSSRR